MINTRVPEYYAIVDASIEGDFITVGQVDENGVLGTYLTREEAERNRAAFEDSEDYRVVPVY